MKQKIFDTICHSIEGENKTWGFMNDDYTISVCMEQYPTQEEAFIKAKEIYFDLMRQGFRDTSEYDAELDLLKEYLRYRVDNIMEQPYILSFKQWREGALQVEINKKVNRQLLNLPEYFEIKEIFCLDCGRKHLNGLVCINPINGMKVPLHELKI